MNWTPYRHLIHFVYRELLRQAEAPGAGAAPGSASSRHPLAEAAARRQAGLLLLAHMDPLRLDPDFVWETPALRNRSPAAEAPPSPPVLFLARVRHHARRALERLLLAYFTCGHDLAAAARQAHQDYGTLLRRGAIPLSEADVRHFAACYWNWEPERAHEARAQAAYARTFLRPDEHRIFEGEVSLDEVRAELGLYGEATLEEELKEVSRRFIRLTSRAGREADRRDELLADPQALGQLARLVTGTTGMARFMHGIAKKDAPLLSLEHFIRKRQSAPDFKPDVLDYSASEDGRSLKDLLAENAEAEAERRLGEAAAGEAEERSVEDQMGGSAGFAPPGI